MTSSDIWIHGITQDSSTGDYYLCKATKQLHCSTGNYFLDLFLIELQNDTIQWIEFSQLTNMQEMPSLQHEYTHIAKWLESTTYKRSISDKGQLRIVMLKKMLDGQNAQTYDFYQVLSSL